MSTIPHQLQPAQSTDSEASKAMSSAVVELRAADLNAQGGVFWPSAKADIKLWNCHPKGYLHVARNRSVKCPYCWTLYKLNECEHYGSGH